MRVAIAGLLTIFIHGAAQAQTGAPAVTDEPQQTPPWAYTLVRPGLKPPADDGKPVSLPGSKISYTWTEIRNLFSAKDWFPGEHPAMPEIVSNGRKPDVYACGMRDGNGAFVVTQDTQVVVTNNQQGNGKVTCQANVMPSISGRAQQWDFDNTGLLCGTPSGTTRSWHEVVSAKGEATLQCHTNPGNP